MGEPSGENKLDQAIAWHKNHGLVPGQSLRYIQFAGGRHIFMLPEPLARYRICLLPYGSALIVIICWK